MNRWDRKTAQALLAEKARRWTLPELRAESGAPKVAKLKLTLGRWVREGLLETGTVEVPPTEPDEPPGAERWWTVSSAGDYELRLRVAQDDEQAPMP